MTSEEKKPINVTFAIIKKQVKFIDTVKYFQQSLGSLVDSMTDVERQKVRKICSRFLANKFMFLSEKDKQWVLDYLSSGKGTIPYQMITDYDSLKIKPEGEFFKREDFYSSLKEKDIDEDEYESVKKFFKVLRLKTLGDLNRIYNFQDTAILCEIFEERADLLQKLFKYNARKCNSASSFSGCIHRLKSKCQIALPTDAEIIRVFETTLIGGYSCVNIRMAFDTDLLLKDPQTEKVLFKTVDGELKCFLSKIIKIDENNQYGQAMTKFCRLAVLKRKKTYRH